VSLQVNLMKKTERRYQGIVSMKVMIFCSVSVLAGVMMLVFSLAGISKVRLSTNLERARQEWGRLEPQETGVRRVQAAAAANRKSIDMLDARMRGEQVFIHTVLQELQRNVPDSMELENLFVGLDQAGAKAPVYNVLRFSGRVQGELTAVDVRRTLSANELIHRFCGEVRLVSSRREAGDIWAFAIEGRREGEGGAR